MSLPDVRVVVFSFSFHCFIAANVSTLGIQRQLEELFRGSEKLIYLVNSTPNTSRDLDEMIR